jgi:TetR/AcrR family transcriptional regulator
MKKRQPQKARATRGAAATREKILRNATQEFTARGYAGARIEAIATHSGVAKGLVFHHFVSKRELYVSVMERLYQTLRERQNETSLVGLAPEEGVRRLVLDTFRSFRELPEIVGLMNEENLHRGEHIKGSKTIPALYNPLIAAIEHLLNEGQAAGILRSDVDPVALYIALSGVGYFYFANRFTLGTVFQINLLAPERVAAYENLIVEMVLAYLRPRQAD